MPTRIGFLYDKIITDENFIGAVMGMTKNKKKNRKAKRMRKNAVRIGKEIAEEFRQGLWVPTPFREHLMYDKRRKKLRRIKVPCLKDQVIHHAVMRVMAPYLMARNYYYNCGSIPKAGQGRAVKAVKKWAKKKRKFYEKLDIRKFYDSLKHSVVLAKLRKIFKDERLIKINAIILASMSNETGIGIAIGFYPSQWYGNLVLNDLDRLIKQVLLPLCDFTRYMDDFLILGNNKRKLIRAREAISNVLRDMSLQLKKGWVIGYVKNGIRFLNYRFFKGFTIMKKDQTIRISKVARSCARKMTVHKARTLVSYNGIMAHCDSHNFKTEFIYPFTSIKKAKGVISSADKFKQTARAI